MAWVLLAGLLACGGGDSPTGNADVAAVEVTAGVAALQVGQTTQLTAVAVDAGGVAIPNAGAVTWASGGTAIVTVSSSGLARAVATGSASVSATVRGVTGSLLMTVLPPGAGAVVTMPGESFVPFMVEVRVGQRVYFDFPQLPHNVIFERKPGAPADIQQTSRQVVSRQFNTVGQFAYDCTLHPGMSGLVGVVP